MKRIGYVIFSVLLTILFLPNVYAASIKTYVNGPSSVYSGDTIKVSIGVSNAPVLYGFTGKISYDTSKLKLSKSSGLSGFSILLGQNFTADSASGKSGSFSFIELVFTPTSSFKAGEKTTISLGNVETSDGDNTLSCTSSSLTVTMKAPKSKNNYLSSLKIDQGNISFNKSKDTYSIVVEHDISKVTIDAKAEDSKSKVSGTGSKALNDYENVFKIVVTSESGAKKTYTVIVTRKDKDGKTTKPVEKKETDKELEKENDNIKPTLNGLKIDGYDLDFDKDKYSYRIDLKENDTKLNIIPDYDKTKYTCEIVEPKDYVIGENQVKIILKDKDNNEIEYSIIVFKKEVVKDENTNEDTCKCNEESCKYKKIFIIENIILLILLLLGLIIRIVKKKKKDEIEIIK